MLVTCLPLLTLEMVFRLLEEPSLGHMLKVNLRYIYIITMDIDCLVFNILVQPLFIRGNFTEWDNV